MQVRQFFPLRPGETLAITLVAVVVWAAPGAALTSTVGEQPPLQTYTSAGHVVGFSETGYFVSNGTYALRVEFDGAKAVAPVSEGQVRETTAASGEAGSAAPLGKVTYAGLWDGIDGTYDAAGGILRSTWTVAPGADPGKIRLKYNVPVEITAQGELGLRFETGALTESRPIAWQDIDGERHPVDVAFLQHDTHAVGFTLGAYRDDRPLVIDPTLTWNTFLGDEPGGWSWVESYGVAVDGSGGLFITGSSTASWGDPVSPHSEDGHNTFVSRLNRNGNLVWNTFLGDNAWGESSGGIAVDGSGNVFVTGISSRTWGSPVRPFSGWSDAFVARLDSSGNLVWNTFLGGSDWAFGTGIAVDGSSNVYATGFSRGSWGSPVRPFSGGITDAFVARLSGANGTLVWNTFLDSSRWEASVPKIAVDGSGNIFVSGYSSATWGSPVRPHSGGTDAFVVRLDSSGNLIWNTFLGSSDYDDGSGIAVDGGGNVFVTGTSGATWGSPIRPHSGHWDAFVARLDSGGNLIWNTFLGSSGYDEGSGIAVDVSGNVFATGWSDSTWGSPMWPYAEFGETFVARLNLDGDLLWNTFLGGHSISHPGTSSAPDGLDSIFVAGTSLSSWGAPLRAFSGEGRAFVSRLPIDFDGVPEVSPTPTVSPSSTTTQTRTPTPSPSGTATSTPTQTPTTSSTPTPSRSATSTPTATRSATASPTGTSSPSHTPTPTATPSSTQTPTATPTLTPSPTQTPTATLTASASPTNTPVPSYTATPTPEATATATSAPPTSTPDATPTGTVEPSATSSPSPTRTPTQPVVASPTPTVTQPATATPTPSPSAVPTATPSPMPTASPTFTPSALQTAPPTSSPTTAPTGTPTETAAAPTHTPEPEPTHTPTPEPTEPAVVCAGDCNGDGRVTVDEIVRAVAIALGNFPASECPAADRNGDGQVTVDELVRAVAMALGGCPQE